MLTFVDSADVHFHYINAHVWINIYRDLWFSFFYLDDI